MGPTSVRGPKRVHAAKAPVGHSGARTTRPTSERSVECTRDARNTETDRCRRAARRHLSLSSLIERRHAVAGATPVRVAMEEHRVVSLRAVRAVDGYPQLGLRSLERSLRRWSETRVDRDCLAVATHHRLLKRLHAGASDPGDQVATVGAAGR